MSEFTVHEFEDLDGAQLSSAGKDAVLHVLASGEWDAVVWIEEWAREDKDLDPLENTTSLFGVTAIVAETEKAWGITQSDEEDPSPIWIAKSVAECYRRDPTYGTKPKTSPQKGLEEFA